MGPTRSGFVHQQRQSAATLSRLSQLSGYGDDGDTYQPVSFDPNTGAPSGTGFDQPAPPAGTSGGTSGGGQIPYYLAAPGTPANQIDWSTAYTQPTGGPGVQTYTPGSQTGTDSSAGFWSSLASGLFKSIGGAGTPVAPKPVVQQPAFPTWAIVLGGIGTVGVVALLLKK
jgi:hypothetical protein